MQTAVLDPNKQTELFLVNVNYYLYFDLSSYNPATTTKISKVQLSCHLPY